MIEDVTRKYLGEITDLDDDYTVEIKYLVLEKLYKVLLLVMIQENNTQGLCSKLITHLKGYSFSKKEKFISWLNSLKFIINDKYKFVKDDVKEPEKVEDLEHLKAMIMKVMM